MHLQVKKNKFDRQKIISVIGGGVFPPSVSIISPTSGDVCSISDVINFSTTVNDNEDGDLTNSIVWTSDIDGEIGIGGVFD